ncbi:hypothetical protein JG687_00017234, partial [Phytophthora cactorum]
WTVPGAKRCFERVLSKVLPGPTPGDVVIHVTIEILRAFFDYENPNHPLTFPSPLRTRRGSRYFGQTSAATVPSQISGSHYGSDTTGYLLVPSRRVLRGKQVIPTTNELP